MITRPFSPLILAAFVGLAPGWVGTTAAPAWQPLGDGKTFQGWAGNFRAFRICDEAGVGESLQSPVPQNEYLSTRKTYAEPDSSIPQKGVIGLPIHQGQPSRASYKDVRIQRLPSPADEADGDSPDSAGVSLLTGRFQWRISPPRVLPAPSSEDTFYSIKDPSVVFHEGRWHLFCTVRGQKRSHQIEYLSFSDWDDLQRPQRRMLAMHQGFFCAPQVFYFTPQKKWYLICQASDSSWDPEYGAAYATTTDLEDPDSWSALQPLGNRLADGKSGLDFWVICDETTAHLFFTTLDGRMWRESMPLQNFPHGWSEPVLAIQGDIFEASHTYRLRGMDKYLTVVEAQGGHGWRYFKAYLADRLDGVWTPLAATKDQAFASMANAQPGSRVWTDCISHGELLRAGIDQRLEIDPSNLRFLFQGVADAERSGKPYGQIPWRLGLLEPQN